MELSKIAIADALLIYRYILFHVIFYYYGLLKKEQFMNPYLQHQFRAEFQ